MKTCFQGDNLSYLILCSTELANRDATFSTFLFIPASEVEVGNVSPIPFLVFHLSRVASLANHKF